MARYLVTGGAGFVGLPLVRRLASEGHEVTVIDNLSSGRERRELLPPAVRFVEADLCDSSALESAFDQAHPKVVLHLAAIHFIPECNRRPVAAVTTNVVGTSTLLQTARPRRSVERVVLISSAAVYPPSDRFMTETDPTGPNDVYGTTKAVNEVQGQLFGVDFPGAVVVVRLFNVFGAGETNPHVIPEIVRQLKAGSTTLSLGDVKAKRSYVHVDDVVDGLVRLSQCALERGVHTVNLGSDAEASVEEVVAALSLLLDKPISIVTDPARLRPSERPFLRCDPSRLTTLTGWRPRTALHEGLRSLLASEGLL